MVGDAERAVDVLVHEQDGFAVAREAGDDLVDLRRDPRLDAGGRLVDQQHLRVAHQGARDLQLALLAAGERAGGLLAPLRQDGELG